MPAYHLRRNYHCASQPAFLGREDGFCADGFSDTLTGEFFLDALNEELARFPEPAISNTAHRRRPASCFYSGSKLLTHFVRLCFQVLIVV
jgi:hypothetical protein